MIRPPPSFNRTYTLFPDTTPVRSLDTVGLGAVRQRANIAARAEAAALGMIDDASADALILSPLKQGLVNGGPYARGERMYGIWAVQANAADPAFPGKQDFIGDLRSMSLATIIPMPWLGIGRTAWRESGGSAGWVWGVAV